MACRSYSIDRKKGAIPPSASSWNRKLNRMKEIISLEINAEKALKALCWSHKIVCLVQLSLP
jgi:hypothetical protein